MRVYRFQDKLWFLEYKRRWRQIDAKPDTVFLIREHHRDQGDGALKLGQ